MDCYYYVSVQEQNDRGVASIKKIRLSVTNFNSSCLLTFLRKNARTHWRYHINLAQAMHEVHYITITDLTRTINRDLKVGKRPAALITTCFTKRGEKRNLDIFFVHLRAYE